jgi:hypothetical protein
MSLLARSSSSEPANSLCKLVILGFVLGPLKLTLRRYFLMYVNYILSLMKGKGKHHS